MLSANFKAILHFKTTVVVVLFHFFQFFFIISQISVFLDIVILIFRLGSTPLGMYKKLIEYHKEGQLSFQYVITFNMDEYVDLPRDHPESYHSFMWTNFFKHVDIDPKNAHILDGNADNLDLECQNFEKKIKDAGGIQLFIGGTFSLL